MRVVVHIENPPNEVEVHDASTYAELKRIAAQMVDVYNVEHLYIADADGKELADDDDVDVIDGGSLWLKERRIDVTIRQLGVQKVLSVPLSSTLNEVKAHYEADAPETLDFVSMMGVELPIDDQTLLHHGFSDGVELVGKMGIIVQDIACDIETKLEVHDHHTIRSLLDRYCQQTNRVLHEGFTLTKDDVLLAPDDVLYHSNIQHNDILTFTTPPFIVEIHTEDPNRPDAQREPIELEINDSMTILAVKRRYFEHIVEDVDPSLKLLQDAVELGDHLQVHQLKLTAGARLVIQREVVSSQYKYICGECGADVRLKEDDALKCRFCGCLVVYKQRTREWSSYKAR